ncbi:MAG: 3-hydroxyacyl-ACP dehydratase FabZ [Candidatus Eutrophobiaceae bacterium]
MSNSLSLDLEQIKIILPHRAPFLMVDRVTECVPGESIRAVKEVRADEYWVPGHFPGNPIMPGVLILEAFAQVSGLLGHITRTNPDGKPDCVCPTEPGQAFLLVGVGKARFKRQVRPGDTLIVEARLAAMRHIWTFEARANVDGQLSAKADIMIADVQQG